MSLDVCGFESRPTPQCRVAQLEERAAVNRVVASSSLVAAANDLCSYMLRL